MLPRATTAAALLACLTFLAGCSGSNSKAPEATGSADPSAPAPSTGSAEPGDTSALAGLSAQEVWQKSVADAAAAKTVHVAAKLLAGKEKIGLDLKLSDVGKAFGTLTFDGNKITIRRLGNTMYLKADKGFWTTNADAATAKVLADKWIMAKKGFSAGLEQFFQLTDIDFVLDDALKLTTAEQKALKLAPGVDIGSAKTVLLSDGTGGDPAQAQLLYVAAADPALPLNFDLGSDNSQFMRFRDWNEKFIVLPPKGAIDLAKDTPKAN